MKQKMSFVVLMIMVLVFLFTPMQAREPFKKFNLKFSLGYANLIGGDFPDLTKGLNDMMADLESLAAGTVTDELGYPNWGFEVEAELIYNINKKFGIGFGSGYITRKHDSLARMVKNDYEGFSLTWHSNYRITPITLNGYYYFPLGSKITGFIKAGVGYYFSKFEYDIYKENRFPEEVYWESDIGKAKDSGLGFQGGVGLEFPVAKGVVLFAEATGRYVNLNNWEVEYSFSDSWGYTEDGTAYIWYVEQFEGDTGKYYPTLELDMSEPSHPSLRSVRKAEFSVSGIAFKLGIKISF